MPKLPIYSPKGTVSANPVPAEARRGANLDTSYISNIADAAVKFQEAQDTMQYTISKANFANKVADINRRMAEDPDYNNADSYIEELTKAKEKSSQGFKNPLVAQKVANENELITIGEKAKILNTFRKKQIIQSQLSLDGMNVDTRDKYISTGNPSERALAKQSLANLNLQNLRTGVISKATYDKYNKDMEKWEEDRALYDADHGNPVEVSKNIGDYDITGDKTAVLNKIENLAKIKQKQFEINQQMTFSETQNSLIELMNTPTSYIDKLNTIQDAENGGTLDKTTAETLKKYLNSSNKENAKTYNENMYEAVRLIGDLQEKFDDKSDHKDGIEYLKRLKDARNYIIKSRANGKLTEEDEKKLLQDINNKTIKESRESAKLISESGSMLTFGYNNAAKIFEKKLVNKALKYEAIRMLFNASGENAKERKKLTYDILEELNSRSLSNPIAIKETEQSEDTRVYGGTTYKLIGDKWVAQ